MIIKSAEIKNFRMLEDIKFNIDKKTTAIVGKNNSGKTSLSNLFYLFLKKDDFKFEDFSVSTHSKFIDIYKEFNESALNINIISEIQKNIPRISLLLTLEYDEADNLVNLQPFIQSLDLSNEIKILFEYGPESTEKFLIGIRDKLQNVTDNIDNKILEEIIFNISQYKVFVRPYLENQVTENVSDKQVKNLLRCHFIEAQRTLDDGNSKLGTKLSKVFQGHYDLINDQGSNLTDGLLEAIKNSNTEFDQKLKDFFENFISSFSLFGFPGIRKEKLELKSNLDPKTLFVNSIRLFYLIGGHYLPEKYNGLGYSNLIFIISQIIGFQILNDQVKCDLNIVFIEEPEAHMHPQMQEVFIRNINSFLELQNFNVQIVLTTHSSHIIASSEFNTIRYFRIENDYTQVKDLMNFSLKTTPEALEFLKQYLTLVKCDLFFADKAILIEGVVERLLLPIFIKKIDSANAGKKLKEQYISIIEIGGAYMSKFKELMEFLNLKTLIITDMDSVKKRDNGRITYPKIEVTDDAELLTSNITLKEWIPCEEKISNLLSKTKDEKTINNVRVTYQTNTINPGIKCGRSFEEAFIIDNCDYVFSNKSNLNSIVNCLHEYNSNIEVKNDSYKIQEFIDWNKKKVDFAFDLMTIELNSWKVPIYIEEGLLWLKE